MRSPTIRDSAVLVIGFLLVVAWDASAFDLPVTRLFADGSGFAWRDQWFVVTVLHDGARWLAWSVGICLLVNIWWPAPFAVSLSRRQRVGWLVTTIACAASIPVLKRLSLTSCPWSLAEFGGVARHVSHWAWSESDGGSGRCFPAGHSSSAFCFIPGYFALRASAPRAARLWLAVTVAAGILLTAVQVVRGAHFVSHGLWTGWICWAISVAAIHSGPLRSFLGRWTKRGADKLAAAWTRPRSAVFVVIALAAWLTLTANLALWRTLLRADGGRHIGWTVCVVVPIVLFCATATLLSGTAWSRWMKPVWMVVLAAAAVSQHFMLTYGVVIDKTMLASVWQTNASEARDLLAWPLLGNVLVVAVLPSAWLFRLHVVARSWRRSVAAVLTLFAVSLSAGAVATAASFRTLAPLVRNHMELRYMPNPITPLWSAGRLALRPLSSSSTSPRVAAVASLGSSHFVADAKPPLVVVVIGETARADHFALNGYPRSTTPELAERGTLSYRNAWSCGTSTLASVPCMFSALGQGKFSSGSANAENLLDTLQAAGIAVLWIDNQAGCKGVCDRAPNVSTDDIRGTAEGQRLCDAEECLDEALLVGIDARIERLPAARRANGIVVVLHMMGSHGPAYARRSPADRKPFRPECVDLTLGACDRAQLINSYDNTIAYTDHVLARTIDWLKSRSEQSVAMLYVSDHGESLGEYGMFLHGLPYAFAPDVQKHVPLVLWLGSDMTQRYALSKMCLRRQLDERLSHDNLYHTVLGLADVQSSLYRESLDFVRACSQTASR